MAQHPLVYGAPGLVYDQGVIYNQGYYTPIGVAGSSMVSGPEQPLRRAVTVKFYDSQGLLQDWTSSNGGYCSLLGLSWDVLPQGPGEMTLELSRKPTGIELTHGGRVDVHLWNDREPYWTGFLDQIPDAGANRTWTYKGQGWQAQLDWIFIEAETYTGQQVRLIVDDLIKRYVEPMTGIVYAGSKIQAWPASLYEVEEIRFKVVSVKQALDQLAKLAGGAIYGVDNFREFFFKPPTEEVTSDQVLMEGRNMRSFVSDEDSSDIKNCIYIKHGKLNEDTESPRYKTNYLEFPISDQPSIDAYRKRCMTVTAPSVYNTADAYRWAAVELEKRKNPVRRGKLEGVRFDGTRIECDGLARVFARGQTYELEKKRVSYRLAGTGIEVSLQLGGHPLDGANLLARLIATQEQLSLLQQISQEQL